jgi:hypothetical protein
MASSGARDSTTRCQTRRMSKAASTTSVSLSPGWRVTWALSQSARGNNRRARKDIVHRQTNRTGDLGLRVTKPTVQAKVDLYRMAGSTVLTGVEPSTTCVTFKYFDGAYKKLPNSSQPGQLLPAHATIVDAKLAAMKTYELWSMSCFSLLSPLFKFKRFSSCRLSSSTPPPQSCSSARFSGKKRSRDQLCLHPSSTFRDFCSVGVANCWLLFFEPEPLEYFKLLLPLPTFPGRSNFCSPELNTSLDYSLSQPLEATIFHMTRILRKPSG